MTRLLFLLFVAALALPTTTTAQPTNTSHDWCDRGTYSRDGNDQPVYCEVRILTLSPRQTLRAEASPNGGVHVEGWDRDDVRVLARVQARSRTETAAQALAETVLLRTDGTLRAEAPKTKHHEWIAVGYRIMVPHRSNLDLTTFNGGISIQDVNGEIRFDALNGGVFLKGLGGNVQGHTTNGGLSVDLMGSRWDGDRLDVSTTNGSISLDIPRNYSAEVETGTVNGRVRHNLPVTASRDRRQKRRVRTTLGDGGSLVRVTTINGGVSVDLD